MEANQTYICPNELGYHSNIGICVLALLILSLFSCQQKQKPAEAGKQLAENYCQACHLQPDPKDLDMSTWKYEILPTMAEKLGYNTGRSAEIELLQELHLFPDTSTLTPEAWNQIREYFISASPALNTPAKPDFDIHVALEGFQVFRPVIRDEPPYTSLVHIEPSLQLVFYGNAIHKSLNTYSLKKGKLNSISLSGAPSHLIIQENGYYVLTMSKLMPHNEKAGTLTFIPRISNGEWGRPQVWIDDLQRPVHASLADLDLDGKNDMVISSFGNLQGELVWYSEINSNDRKKHMLRPLPGAVKSAIDDINKDGMPDILALMAQGDEGFFLYLNQGNGQFQEQALMRFPPTYGSTYFELLDMNNDGLKDILYTNGDNGDYPPIVKNYHGIRLFLNRGNMEFEEAFFMEQHGVFKASAEDFDQDGDIDIAAQSYFPDFKYRPEESFVYYENKGDLTFEAFTFEKYPGGKWLTMSIGDIDGDKDADIVLGSAMFMIKEVPTDILDKWKGQAPPLLILQNALNSVQMPEIELSQ